MNKTIKKICLISIFLFLIVGIVSTASAEDVSIEQVGAIQDSGADNVVTTASSNGEYQVNINLDNHTVLEKETVKDDFDITFMATGQGGSFSNAKVEFKVVNFVTQDVIYTQTKNLTNDLQQQVSFEYTFTQGQDGYYWNHITVSGTNITSKTVQENAYLINFTKVNFNTVTVESGWHKINGDYQIIFSDEYTTATAKFEVKKGGSVVYTDTKTLSGSLSNQVSFITSNLSNGDYTTVLTVSGTGITTNNATNSVIMNAQAFITILTGDIKPFTGRTINMDLTLKTESGDNLTSQVVVNITKGSTIIDSKTVDVTNGKGTYSYGILDVGEYNITAAYSGVDEYYQASSFMEGFTVEGIIIIINSNVTVKGSKLNVTYDFTSFETYDSVTAEFKVINSSGSTVYTETKTGTTEAKFGTDLAIGDYTLLLTVTGTNIKTATKEDTVQIKGVEVNIKDNATTEGHKLNVDYNITFTEAHNIATATFKVMDANETTVYTDSKTLSDLIEEVSFNVTLDKKGLYRYELTVSGNGITPKTSSEFVYINDTYVKFDDVNVTTEGNNLNVTYDLIFTDVYSEGVAIFKVQYANGTQVYSETKSLSGSTEESLSFNTVLDNGNYFHMLTVSGKYIKTDTYIGEVQIEGDHVTTDLSGNIKVNGKDINADLSLKTKNGEPISGTVTVEIKQDTTIINSTTVNIVNGQGTYEYGNLDEGHYILTATYAGSEGYLASSFSQSFSIGYPTPKVDIKFNGITYGESATVAIIVTGDEETPAGNVTLYIDDSKYGTKTLVNGEISFVVYGLSGGDHTIRAVYTPINSNYTESDNSSTIKVEKAETSLVIDISKIDDTSVIINLNLTDENNKKGVTGEVILNITSDKGYNNLIPVTVTNGNGNYKLENLNNGNYTVEGTYFGSTDYKSSIDNAKFEINYAPTEYSLKADNVVKYYLNDTQYHVTLTEDGKPVAGKKVLVTLNAQWWANPKSYNITTNASGVATLNIKLIAGFYTITATFENATPVTTNITVKDVFETRDVIKYYKNGTDFTISVVDKAGNPAVNKEVILKLSSDIWSNPVTYTITTNSSGMAVLPINLIAGTYSIVTIVDGVSKYNNIFVLPTLTATSITKKISQSGSLTARLVDGQGNPLAGKEIKFTVKTQTYTFTTDEKGIATLPIHLGLGTWSFIISDPSSGASTRATVKVIA